MDNDVRFELQIEGQDRREADELASSLLDELQYGIGQPVRLARLKPAGADTQELGAIIVAILATGAARELFAGVKAWLGKNRNATLTIKQDGTVIAENISQKNVAAVLAARTAQQK